MKIKLHILTTLAAAAVIAVPMSAHAKKKADAAASATPAATATPAASPAEKAERAIPFYGKVSAVDAKAKTFSIANKDGTKTRVFKITDKSVITKAGAPATFADIAKDGDIRGSYWKKADGSLEVKTAKVGPLTAAEQAEKDAKDAKKEAKKAAKAAASASPAAAPTAKP
jgi:hypothetical protein